MLTQDTTYYSKNTFIFPVKDTGMVELFVSQQDEAYMYEDSGAVKVKIFQQKIATPALYNGKLFNKLSKVNSMEIKSFSPISNDWITLILIFVFFILAMLQKNFYKQTRLIFNAFISYRYTPYLTREGNILNEFNFYVLLFIAFISLSIAVYLKLHLYSFVEVQNQVFMFAKIFAVLLILYLIKVFGLLFLANVFKVKKLFNEWLISQHVFFIITAIIILFLSSVFLYTEYIYYNMSIIVILIVVSIFYLYRLFILVYNNGMNNLFHFLLYLCTIEILPVLIIYKLLKN
ncbi:MAG: DUF4271 domain-containing protein [Bacteroidales bacterium]|nr:DUF4271 domain-containing protein [Bacteroidales bacterium]